LFVEIFHTVGGAVAGDFLGLGLFGVGIADDYGAAARFILQAESDIIEDAFATVVDARAKRLAERAIADFFGLRRNGRGFHFDRRGAIRRPAAAIVHAYRHRVVSGREARSIEVHGGAIPHDLAGIGLPRIFQRIA